jgi:GTP cyclohydrolase I
MLPQELLDAYTVIVNHLKSNTTDAALLANFEGTPERCAKALLETCSSDDDIASKLGQVIKTSFPVDYGDRVAGMITQGPIIIDSHCPHHLYPVRYAAYVSYIPKTGGKVLGLSKLSRVCKILGKRPVLHEQLACDIVGVLHNDFASAAKFPSIETEGSAVLLVGMHMCMCCRGVNEPAMTSVSELRGVYWEQGFEEKFYKAVESLKSTKVF